MITREEAFELLKKYNKEEFHIHHGITLECVMRYLAKKHGYGDEAEFWALCGLLHDIDFEMWPDEHCKKRRSFLTEAGVDERMIHAVVSHGYGLCSDVAPEHEMEKILFAVDELTGLIGAAASDEAFQKRQRYGAEIPEEKVQGQAFCRRLRQRSHQTGRGTAGLGAG